MTISKANQVPMRGGGPSGSLVLDNLHLFNGGEHHFELGPKTK